MLARKKKKMKCLYIFSEQAEILAKFKPVLDVSNLIPNIRNAEKYIRDCLDHFNTTRHMILYYEDIVRNRNVLKHIQML